MHPVERINRSSPPQEFDPRVLFWSGKLAAAGRIYERNIPRIKIIIRGCMKRRAAGKMIKKRRSERRQPVNFFSIEILY
jgi:hypothetical protein